MLRNVGDSAGQGLSGHTRFCNGKSEDCDMMIKCACVAAATAAVALLSVCAHAGPTTTKHLDELQAKEPGSLAARREWTNWQYNQTRAQTIAPRVIYGADDRIEVWEETDPILQDMAEAACVVVHVSELTDNGDGTYTLNTSPWNSQSGQPLCAGEPFAGQQQIGNCSGWFVGGDLIVTAGHCIDSGDIGTWGYMFNFEIDTMGGTTPTIVPADDVYWVTGIVNQQQAGGYDHSVTIVDRPVVGRNPVPIMRGTPPALGTPMTVIGHPVVLPKKIAGGAVVKGVDAPDTFFQANLDTYGGNSGSMVINMDTYEVAGILVRGATDFVDGGGCTQSNQVPDSGNTGGGLTFEEVSLTMHFENFIPVLGATVSPGGNTTSVGIVGGPFSNDTVNYTIDNTTGDPLDYTVTLTDPDAILLLDGGTSPIGGTIAGGANTGFLVTLAPGATSLPAGIYSGDVVVDDITNSIQTVRTHTVEIGQTLVTVTPENDLGTGGPIGGPFNATELYTVTSQRPSPVLVGVTASESWISINGGSSDTLSLSGTGDSDTALIGIDAAAGGSLPAGLYTGTVTFENLDNNDTTTRTVSLDVGRFVFASVDTPIGIADNSTIQSSVSVSEPFCIGDVDVDMDISHTFIGDLTLTLTSPNGTSVTLHNRTGSSADDIMVRYDDDGFAPDGPGALGDFNNEGSTGVWTLSVSDGAGGDTGTLNSWALRLASAGSSCPPAAFDGSASGLANANIDITLAGSSSDGLPLSYIIESLPSNGRLFDSASSPIIGVPTTLPDASVTYKPAVDFLGGDSFGFSVDDGSPSNTATVAITLGGSSAVIASFSFDTDPGWSVEGLWAFGQPQGVSGDPSSGYSGTNVYGHNLAGNYSSNMSPESLTTTAIDCSNATDVTLRFRRWLGVEHSTYDHASIGVGTDGVGFTEIWHNPGGAGNTINEAAWSEQTYDISSIADDQSTVYINWAIGPTDGLSVYHSWNIDDVEIIGTVSGGCAADLTTQGAGAGEPGFGVPDGQISAADINYYINAWVSGDPLTADMTTQGAGVGDPGFGFPDGATTAADINFFVNLWVGGCP